MNVLTTSPVQAQADNYHAVTSSEPLAGEVEEETPKTENNTPTEEIAPAAITTESVAQAPTTTAAAPVQQACSAARPYIYIADVGLCANIMTIGRDDGHVGVPPNTYQAGWYNESAWFGTGGTSFVDGHSPGVFSAIKSVSIGSIITIGLADGQDLSYRVVGTEISPLNSVDMYKALYTHNLNLMTCHGNYDSSIATYDQRFIVYSDQI